MKLTEERVNTIQEALNLAKKYKSQGKYDIFRGQRQLWSIVPSIMRKSESERQNDILNLNRFATWIANSSDYNHMIDDKDRILSIAQHYHLPTYFVDFTYSPDIAAFFASDGEIQHGSEGCIFCASLSILESEFEDLRDHLQSDIPKIVEIDVNNLWRLEAQEGLFLDLSLANNTTFGWEELFSFHHIIFRHSENQSAPISRNKIYPVRKSALEIDLDQYFRLQDIQVANAKMENLHTDPWQNNIFAFKNSVLPNIHPSWSTDIEKIWRAKNTEKFEDVITEGSIHLDINVSQHSPKELITVIAKQFKSKIDKTYHARQVALSFEIILSDTDVTFSASMHEALELYWDGIRQLPYTDDEIATGFGTLVTLLYKLTLEEEKDLSSILPSIYPDIRTIEILVENGSHHRMKVSTESITESFRQDIDSFLNTEMYPDLQNKVEIIYHLCETRRLFDFERFRKLMVEQMIPLQILSYFDKEGLFRSDKVLVIFNPFIVEKLHATNMMLAGYTKHFRHFDRLISLHIDMLDEDLHVLMYVVTQRLMQKQRPATVTFAGFENDPRGIWEIPELSEFSKRLLKVGFISILEVTTMMPSIKESYDPMALGALEIWLLANHRMKREVRQSEYSEYLLEFFPHLGYYNQLHQNIVTNMSGVTELDIKIAKIRGSRGNSTQVQNMIERWKQG